MPLPEPGAIDLLQDLPPLREVIAKYGLSARKGLGQNFLLDLNLTRRIARAAGDLAEGTVIEIGPGPGGLTRALLAEGATAVFAIEKDSRCLAALEDMAGLFADRLTLIPGDALEVDVASLGAPPRRIVANLPYNVATPLLLNWLGALVRDPHCLSRLVLMFQKEVAERLCAAPRTKAYGRLSIMAQWLCTVRPLFDVPARAFVPAPKIVSSVVALDPRPAPLAPARMATLERVTAAAFGQRRKMLRQSLRTLGANTSALIAAAGVSETARAEELEVAEFCALARALDGEP